MPPLTILETNVTLPVVYVPKDFNGLDEATLKLKIDKAYDELEKLASIKTEVVEAVTPYSTEDIETSERFKAIYMDTYDEFERLLRELQVASDTDRRRSRKREEYQKDIDRLDDVVHKPNAKVKKLCKKLFYKISNRTHPDKIDPNSPLVNYYYEAKGAYSVLDIHALEQIWERVKNKSDRARAIAEARRLQPAELTAYEELEARVISLQTELKNVEYEISEFKQDEFYFVITMYLQNGSVPASGLYRSILKETIQFYKSKIKEYERKIKDLKGGYFEFDVEMDIPNPAEPDSSFDFFE